MNLEFIIEGRQTRDEVVKFRGVGIKDEEIVHYKGEGGGVGVVVTEEHGDGCIGEAELGQKSGQSEVGIRAPIWEDQAQFLVHHKK
jgi:hypothetical protein